MKFKKNNINKNILNLFAAIVSLLSFSSVANAIKCICNFDGRSVTITTEAFDKCADIDESTARIAGGFGPTGSFSGCSNASGSASRSTNRC